MVLRKRRCPIRIRSWLLPLYQGESVVKTSRDSQANSTQIPIVGVLVYGIAEASTAYLITKITDPPPPPIGETGTNPAFVEDQTTWHQKKNVLGLALSRLDRVNVRTTREGEKPLTTELPGKKFT